MVLGNVIGSNITNILLILGIAAIINNIKIKDTTVKKELPMALLISVLFVVLFIDTSLKNGTINQITRQDAIVIILFFTVFVHYLISLALLKKDKQNDDEKPRFNLITSLILIILGIASIIIGSNLVVNNASIIAKILGLSDRVISLTIIAFGTSLPELVTTIVSSKKGELDLLLGNIIGSNIFNICVVLGVPVAIYGTLTPASFQWLDLVMLILSSLILYIFAKTKREITKSEGIIMTLLFIIYYTIVFII